MKQELHKPTSAAVLRLLRPLVRILLRNGIPFGAFADLAKAAYVDVATREFSLPGRRQSDSRVSVLTGLTRKEVRRVRTLPPADDLGASERYNRAARVVAGWVRDERFREGGEPEPLPLDGEGATFAALVRAHGGDVPARAVLDELERVGAAERAPDGRVRLLARAYVPRTGEVEKIGILGTDVAELVGTIDRNLRAGAGEPLFQRKASYDNIPEEALPEARRLARERAQRFLEEMDRLLARHDRDANPEVKGTGRRSAGMGIFWFEDGDGRGNGKEDDGTARGTTPKGPSG